MLFSRVSVHSSSFSTHVQVYHCRLRRRHKEADYDGGNSVEKLQPFFGEATPAKEGSVAVPSTEGGSTAPAAVPSAAAAVPTTTTNGEKVETQTSNE